jgi:hypothetical protein
MGGGTAEAVEDVEDVGAEACEAQCADSGCHEEELGCGQRVESVRHRGWGRRGVGAAIADANIDVDGKWG